MPRALVLSIFIVAVTAPLAFAQKPVAVGKGSYASSPPAGQMMDRRRNVDLVAEVENRNLYLVADDGRPIPSNKWYQSLIFQKYGTGLWAMPHKVDATAEGLEVFYPTKFDGGGTRSIAEFPLVVTGKDFKPVDSRAKQWTDWTVAFRSYESERKCIDVTLGEGMPFVWCEFTGVQPVIALGGLNGKGTRGRNTAHFFDDTGPAVQLPRKTSALGLTYEGRSFGVFAPEGTTFESTADGIGVNFAEGKTFLVIAPLPSANDLRTFGQYAYAVPRDSKLSWTYDRAAGTITTHWQVFTEALQGSSKAVLQGFLPHHWRENMSGLTFTDVGYTTIRGKMKCAAGESFALCYSFNGILPNLPAPTKASGFDADRMKTYLADYFAKKGTLAADTYAGGKDLQQFAQAAFMARQIQDPSADPILAKTRSTMEDWLTYSADEKDHFFAYYPRRKGLIGFNPSFGSEHFTDNHFHYGYFVYAAGLLGQLQPDFASQYGEMAKLIAKTYANYDRADARFPFFRTFDLWRGHSFADGNGFADGNNQESTGEAVNSWVGMILLGEALGDADLTAAGVMGYSFESRANLEYWFDPHGDIFPKSYPHKACGIIWCNSIVWGTWFTASPAWIYGIQWLPSGPHAAFYDRDPAFIKKAHADAMKELEAFETREASRKPGKTPKPATFKAMGGELASYHLAFLMHADPSSVVDELDKLWSEPDDKTAHNPWMTNIYYQAHALKGLGRVDWTCHGDSPTSMVYLNPTTQVRTFVAWNPTDRVQTVEFFQAGKSIAKVRAPARQIVAGH